jgi:hypothetical protein
MKQIKVTNRSDGNVGYELPEMNIRRVFVPNETKEISEKELNALYQTDGGATLIKEYLFVQNEAWVEKTWAAPIEYSWTPEDIHRCLLEDSLELFSETLDFAPAGIIDLIKKMSWQIPLADLNKISVMRTKLGFDAQAAAQIMSSMVRPPAPPTERKRRREA